MNSLEEIWYETSPYVYALIGALVLLGAESTLATVSGGLLLLASATIMRLRWKHRHQRRARQTDERSPRPAKRRDAPAR